MFDKLDVCRKSIVTLSQDNGKIVVMYFVDQAPGIYPSVCQIVRQLQQRAAGLLLSARSTGMRYRSIAGSVTFAAAVEG